MLVYADEYFFNGSRRAGPSGLWRIQFRNNGEDDHDLRVRRASGGLVLASSRIVRPAGLQTVQVRLKPGRYTLFCSIADHELRGMKWSLLVRAPKVRVTAP
jgi:hypothetical protein